MRILVTGCAGFIGSHLCEQLIVAKHEVVGVDNFDPFYHKEIKVRNLGKLNDEPGFKFYNLDICSYKQLVSIQEEFDMVVHLAAKAGVRPSIEQPIAYIENNISGTQNILNLMLDRKVQKIVFASSSSVYGDKTIAPYSEKATVDFPISPYAFTKKSCELMLYTHYHLYNINSLSLRFFTVYGPKQRPDLAINKFFRSIQQGQPISIYGDGSTSRDYTYISDIISGIYASINLVSGKSDCYEIINLGNNKPIKLIDLIHKIENTIGKKAILNFTNMQPGDVIMTCADISKAQQLLEYYPHTSLDEGLRLYYQWLQTEGTVIYL